jgi:Spy/CpxP family protein refolding chaperone
VPSPTFRVVPPTPWRRLAIAASLPVIPLLGWAASIWSTRELRRRLRPRTAHRDGTDDRELPRPSSSGRDRNEDLILIFSAALFAGGTCLGVALQPKLSPPKPLQKIEPPPAAQPVVDRHRPDFSVHRFASELDLTAEQDRELDAILSDSHDEMQYLGRAMRSAQDKSRERIMNILTEEQKKKLEALMTAERAKRSDAELDRSVATYAKILKLNDEQSKTFRTVLVDGREQRRKGNKPGGDWRESRKNAREQQNKALEKALTPEQYQRYLEVSELERYER